MAWIRVGGERVTVVAYHAPPGVTHGPRKPAQAVQVAWWLATIDGPVVLGGDFNTPEVDHPDLSRVRTHWHTGHAHLTGEPGDDLLVGPDPVHDLRDALRVWLADHPGEMATIRAHSPEGPLAVSYRTSPTRSWRYDAIWESRHFRALAVTYSYEEALRAGTDHALVVAELTLPSG